MDAMAREHALQRVYPEEFLVGGKGLLAAAQGVKKGAAKAADHFSRPKVRNQVVAPKAGAKGNLLQGRTPQKDADVTHAYRNVSQRELDDILSSKFARRDTTPGSAKRTWSDEGKWWSGGDEAGTFGRKWAKGDATVRTAASKVPAERAVRASDLEVYDTAAKRFMPLSKATAPGKFSAGGAVKPKGAVKPRGVGKALRGWGREGKK